MIERAGHAGTRATYRPAECVSSSCWSVAGHRPSTGHDTEECITKTLWVTMTVLALAIAAYALALLLIPGLGPPFIAQRRVLMPVALGAHLVGGLTALAVGPWQMNSRLRAVALGRHRWMGRVYVIAVLVGGLGALGLAPISEGGFVAHVGFGMLAVVWLTATLQAYRRIRAGDQAGHREWMIRSFALTLAAVMLRLYLPLSGIVGIPFADAYQAVAWACWVPNLIVAEWLVLRRSRAESRTQPLISGWQRPRA